MTDTSSSQASSHVADESTSGSVWNGDQGATGQAPAKVADRFALRALLLEGRDGEVVGEIDSGFFERLRQRALARD